MDNFQASTTAYDSSGYNDAQLFVRNLQQDSCFLRFKMNTEGCITCIAWAHHAQQLNAMRYHSIIIQNTFNTSMSVRCGPGVGVLFVIEVSYGILMLNKES